MKKNIAIFIFGMFFMCVLGGACIAGAVGLGNIIIVNTEGDKTERVVLHQLSSQCVRSMHSETFLKSGVFDFKALSESTRRDDYIASFLSCMERKTSNVIKSIELAEVGFKYLSCKNSSSDEQASKACADEMNKALLK